MDKENQMGWDSFARTSGFRPGAWCVWAIACACMMILSGCTRSPDAPPLLAEGHSFPKIALNYSSGNAVSTHTFHGKVLVLNVWATWCPPCRREMPGLEELSRTMDPKRFAVIGVSTDKDALLAEEFLWQNHITFANFFDQGGKIARQLGLKVYPETFLIAPDGVLVKRVLGEQNWSSPAMVAMLEDLYRDHASRTGSTDNNGRRP